MKSKKIKLTFFLLFLITMQGCLIEKSMVRQATTYNRAIADVNNQLLLLNIIRASKKHPLCFTGITTATGSLKYAAGTGGLTIPFGGDAADTYSIAPNATYSSGPSFTIVALDSKEFMQGILTPVTMKTIKYYWDQGWPKELLLHMFIEKINFENKNYIENYPGSRNFVGFQNFIRKYKKIQIIEETFDKTFLNNLDYETVQNLDHTVKALEAGYLIEKNESNKYRLIKKAKSFSFIFNTDKYNVDSELIEPEQRTKNKGKNTIYLRSTEAMIYYLGEIVREELDGKSNFNPSIRMGKEKTTLFRVERCKPREKGYFVKVSYEGETYCIPKNNAGESMHVLNLISQIFSLNLSVKDLPKSGTVNLIVP